MKSVTIIRDRGQLTIPDSIRKIIGWVAPMSAVTISITKPDEIVIKPHIKIIDKAQIWENVKRARSIKGKSVSSSAAEFLVRDRNSH